MSSNHRLVARRHVRRAAFAAVAIVVPVVASSAAVAGLHSTGMTGFSGRQTVTCNQCHSGGTAPTVTLDGPIYVLHDSTRSFSFTVAGGQRVAAGLDIAVDSGTLVATDAGTFVSMSELTHNTPLAVDSAGEATWSFDFTAPAAPATVTMWAAGNSVNLNGKNRGDKASTTTRTITVVDNLTSFAEFGQGLAGTGGIIPHLFGVDGPSIGPWSVEIENGLGAGLGYVWVGYGTATTLLFGGNFYIDLAQPFALLPITLGGTAGVAGDGSLSLGGDDLSALAPLTVYVQATLLDSAAPRNFSMTNALQLDVQN